MKRFVAIFVVVLTVASAPPTPAADAPPTVTTAFTPQCGHLLLTRIKDARREIRVAIYEFTKRDIADALIDRAQHNVKVSVKIDAHESEFEYTLELLRRMEHAKITIEKIKLPANVKMHDKFAVIDGRTVVTGSFNWTKRATEENYENLVAIDSPDIAKQYLAEWDRIKSTP